MTKDEALKLALEYLKLQKRYGPAIAYGNTTIDDCITAIKKARVVEFVDDLTKQPAPVQEPVTLRPEDVTVEVLTVQGGGGFAPLRTHGVKLTHKPTGIVVQCSSERSQHRNREQALRDLERYLHGARPQPTPPNVATPLAAQRQSARSAWVGLSDEQINAFFEGMEPNNGFWLSFARAIEAKLKEKNT